MPELVGKDAGAESGRNGDAAGIALACGLRVRWRSGGEQQDGGQGGGRCGGASGGVHGRRLLGMGVTRESPDGRLRQAGTGLQARAIA